MHIKMFAIDLSLIAGRSKRHQFNILCQCRRYQLAVWLSAWCTRSDAYPSISTGHDKQHFLLDIIEMANSL